MSATNVKNYWQTLISRIKNFYEQHIKIVFVTPKYLIVFENNMYIVYKPRNLYYWDCQAYNMAEFETEDQAKNYIENQLEKRKLKSVWYG